MDRKLTVFMMSSTHWDREWYQPFQGFRWRLVNLLEDAMDKLENHPEVERFTLDGQTIVLEDFLEAAPDQRERLVGLMKEGRIQVGPWYVMPDEYLPSGESHIRNLQMGTAIAKSYGVEPMRYGYVCDVFGHTAQMPQIFRGFDCQGALLGRGITEDKAPAHFLWESPDGSQVMTFKTPDWYGYGEFWVRIHCFDWWRDPPTEEERDENLKAFIEGELKRTDIPVLLFVDGQDHKELHARTLTDAKRRLERLYPGIEVIITSPDEMLPRLAEYRAKMPVVKGELNATNPKRGNFPRLLTNVLSSRYDLKWRNDTCQTTLEKWSGPIAAVSRLTGRKPLRKNFYDLAYRYLIQNHPHDSICGCSPDFVHKDMHYRYDQVEQIAHSIEEYGMQNLSRFADTPGENMVVTLFNSLPYRRRETVTVDLFFDRRWKHKWSEPFGYEPINAFRLVDKDGKDVPYQVINVNRGKGRVHCGEQGSADRHRIVFEADLASGGTTEYRVVPVEGEATRPSGSLRTGMYTAENDLVTLQVEPADGTLTITDKRTGEVYQKQLSFVDDGELGDGYMHARPVADHAILSAVTKSVAVSCDAAAKCTFTIIKEMHLPADMQKYHERNFDLRRNEELKALTITANVSLTKQSPMVEVEMTVDNSARDHRLRLMIPTGVDAPVYRASQAFYVAQRQVEIDPATLTWEEKEQTEKAMSGFAYKRQGNRGLAFVSGGGLHEVGAFPGDEGMLAVTLLRCFGTAVSGHVSEDGQMQGRWQYRFGLLPLAQETDADVQRRLDAFTAGVYCREDCTWQEILPEQHTFYQLEGENTLLSTVKVAEDGEGMVFRLYNLSGTFEIARLSFDRAPRMVALTNLEEQHPETLMVTDNGVDLPMGGWQIKTVYVKF